MFVIGGLVPKMLIWWPGLFAQEADEWLGFSPMMTQALEEAYQTWLQEELSRAEMGMSPDWF